MPTILDGFDTPKESGDRGGGDLYARAVDIVMKDRKPTTSYLQRRLGIGYNRAASLIERMENEGIVGAPNRTGRREILLDASALAFQNSGGRPGIKPLARQAPDASTTPRASACIQFVRCAVQHSASIRLMLHV